jgi:hypothetical protein
MPQGRQAPNFSPATGLTPVATPIDTFSANPATNPMFQLADALSSLNPALTNYAAIQQTKVDAADFQAGQIAYSKAKTNLKEAVDKGTIQPGYSPGFQRGYQQGQLRVMGLDYDQQLRSAYSQSDAANSSDPKAYQSFVQDFTAKYMEDNKIQQGFHPIDVGTAFMPQVDAAQRSLNGYHVEQQAKNIEDNWQANTQNEVSTTIDNAVANKMSIEQIGGAVNDVIGKSMANGWHDKSTFNQQIVKLVTAKAIGSDNPELLDVLKHIPTGPGSTLGNTTFARDAALEAQQHIQNSRRTDQQWQWAKEDRAFTLQSHAWAQQEHAHTMQDWNIEKSAGTLMRSMISQAILDPTQDFNKAAVTLTNLDKDGSHARTFMAFRQSMLDQKNNGADNPNVVTSLYSNMLGHPQTFDPMQIVAAHTAGNISMKTMQSLMDDQRRIAQEGASPLLRDPVYTTMMDGITKAFQGDPDSFDVTKVAQTTEKRMAFQRHALDYLSKNKDNLDQNAFYAEMDKYRKLLIQPLLDNEAPKPKAPNGKPAAQQQGAKSNPYAQPGLSR